MFINFSRKDVGVLEYWSWISSELWRDNVKEVDWKHFYYVADETRVQSSIDFGANPRRLHPLTQHSLKTHI